MESEMSFLHVYEIIKVICEELYKNKLLQR